MFPQRMNYFYTTQTNIMTNKITDSEKYAWLNEIDENTDPWYFNEWYNEQ